MEGYSVYCVFVLLSHHTVIRGILSLLCVCLSFCHFVCTVTDFSAVEKDSGVKVCMLLRRLSGMSFSHFGVQRSKIKVTRDKNALSAANTLPGAHEWYALAASSVQQQRTGAFRGCRGVTLAACVRWRGSVGSGNWGRRSSVA